MYLFNYLMTTFSRDVTGVVVSGLAIVLMLIALVIELPPLMVFAAVLTFPFTYTMGSGSGILLAVRLLPLLQLASAFAISRQDRLIAWICPVLPLLVLISFLLKVVLAQFPT